MSTLIDQINLEMKFCILVTMQLYRSFEISISNKKKIGTVP